MTSEVSHEQRNAEHSCLAANIALTPKRMEVYSALLSAGRPMSAYDLIDSVNCKFSRHITPISIYRMLDFLEQQHLVRKLKSAGKYIAVQPASKTTEGPVSQYLICRECGDVKVLCVDQQVLGNLKNCVNSSGFHLRSLELELDCICGDCSTPVDSGTRRLRPAPINL